MTEKYKMRRIDFDLIRVFACLTILMIHFNASVSGYDYSGQFLYNNGIVPNHYFGCVYLGEIGNSLFFFLSGASLMFYVPQKIGDLFRFYWKRAKALYPAFWIAFIGATGVQLLRYKVVSDASISTLLWSIFGMDGYAMNRGWSTGAFYQIGEWYLGCALLCYLFWPFVSWMWRKMKPLTFGIIVLSAYVIIVKISNGYTYSVSVRLCEMVVGAYFTEYVSTSKNWKLIGGSLLAAAICVYFQSHLYSITVSIAVCWAIFVLLSFCTECFPDTFSALAPSLKTAAGLTYPLFLVHHKLISIIASTFSLEYFPYRYTVVLFVAYLAIAIFLAYWLNKGSTKMVRITQKVYCHCVKSLKSV